MPPLDDLTPDIVELLDAGKSAQAVAQELIVPLNDVLRIVEQRRHAAGVPTKASPPPSRPSLAVVPPTERAMTSTPSPTSNLDLISRGKACDSSKVQRLAEKAEAVMTVLRDELTAYDQQAEARATVDRLRAELKAAEAALRPGGTTRSSASTSKPSADTKTMREWARTNGHQGPDRGRLPAAVVHAYQQAHPA